ncbi:hypothetical protein AVDCRST_MAG84-3886 [uncultured Microcoleus sp.]|uniref:Uncharacterized protein n=1 Tax=uncultured Microcoleus sp. TaxID=259945 RepID=A0A6J4MT91_9CYAN|nr:hypothetical protein AVDCRST_MAG84-3886 [uncultured Microcoleus sp.]
MKNIHLSDRSRSGIITKFMLLCQALDHRRSLFFQKILPTV